jgi:hypothetical protein
MTSIQDLIQHRAQVNAYLKMEMNMLWNPRTRECAQDSSQVILSRQMARYQYWTDALSQLEQINDDSDAQMDMVDILRSWVEFTEDGTSNYLTCEDCRDKWKAFILDLDDGSDVCATCAAHAQ